MKRIGLVIAAGMLGTTGVASAGIAVNQFTSASSQSVGLSAVTKQLAANCWVATGAPAAANCNTSASAAGLPGLDDVTGLVNAGSLVQTAKGLADQAVATAAGAAGAAGAQVAGVSPLECNVNVGVPVPFRCRSRRR